MSLQTLVLLKSFDRGMDGCLAYLVMELGWAIFFAATQPVVNAQS